MIVSVIKQDGLKLSADDYKIPFQLSAGVKMQFIQDENYADYAVMGFFKKSWDNEEKKLVIDKNGIFSLAGECFEKTGTLSISFVLLNSESKIHLGVVDYEIRKAFGSGDEVLPEPDKTWITLVTQVAKDAIKDDVALVNQKASEALNSATLASEKANEAQGYANNAKVASNSATTAAGQAITAKNDAIAASNLASEFSDSAGKNAILASDSANTAKINANKTTEDRNEVERLVSGFDSHVVEKTIEFNQNATDKNDEFDRKVEQANTTINAKVTEATKQAEKAMEEANRATQATDGKLDKNLGAVNANKLLGTDEAGNIVVKEEIKQTAANVSYGDNSNVEVALDDINKKLGDLMYTPISITSFTNNKNTQEMGSTVTDVVLNWNYNKTPKTLMLDSESLDVGLKTKTLSGQSIKTNKTFALKATDERDAVSTKTTAITFLNGIYYGVGDNLEIGSVTNEFILGLTKTLQSNKSKTFTVNAGAGKHIYYIIPSRYGTPVFKVGGFEGGFSKLGTVNFTNASGYAENYDVYKSSNAGLGNTTVVAS